MSVVSRMDQAVNAFVARCAWFHQPMTRGRARMFALQHRLNTRQRNSVLKLKVATNCSDWDTRLRIIQACSERINVPGYGSGLFRKRGWFGIERLRWGKLFALSQDELEFFELHTEADIEHSNT